MSKPKTIPIPSTSPSNSQPRNTPSSLYGPALLSMSPRPLSVHETKQVVASHLVTSDPEEQMVSPAHTMQGGAFTRDIYRWHESQDQQSLSRIASAPVISNREHYDIRQPGGFRRYFLMRQAEGSGRVPRLIARNFIDFLALYGNFGNGEFEPEDDWEENVTDEEALLSPQQSHTEGTASVLKAFFLLIKSFVGTGVLFLPKAFYNGGLLFSTLFLCIVSFLCFHCMILLVECNKVLGGSFGDIGEVLYGKNVKRAVLTSICMSQLGFVCAYMVFVAQNLREVIMVATNCDVILSDGTLIILQLLLYIPFALVRKIQKFSSTALVADVFILLGIAYIYVYVFYVLGSEGIAKVQLFNSDSFALFIGTALFTFEGIGLVLPIATSMKEPEKFPSVLSITMIISTVLFTSVAVFSYLAFGDNVQTVLLLNLPTSAFVEGIQVLYALAIAFSVPLQLFPAIRIMETGFFPHLNGKRSRLDKWQKNFFRMGLTLFLACVAFFGANNLDRFVSLIGGLACLPLSFIYPALFHYKAVAKTKWVKWKDLALAISGFVMMLYVVAHTVNSWAKDGSDLPMSHCPLK